MRPTRNQIAGACLIGFLCFPMVDATSQTSPWPVVFQHGYRADGPSWNPVPQNLQNTLHVQSRAWTTDWKEPLSTQASVLHGLMTAENLPDSTIMVGHSNGGLISRTLSLDRNLRAVITVGTLHKGAPLAQSVLNGDVQGWGALVGGFAANVWNYYYGLCTGREPQDDFGFCHAALSGAAYQMFIGTVIVAAPTVQLFADQGVIHNMTPASSFIGFLNTDENLQREAQAIPGRFAIGSQLPPYDYPYVFFRGTVPDEAYEWSIAADAAMTIQALAVGFYDYYHDPDDPLEADKIAGAPLWGLSAGWLIGADISWCAMIGAIDGLNCQPSDGIVPLDRQRWSGAVPLDIVGPAHQQEKQSSHFFERLRIILSQELQVPPNPTPPPPPPPSFSASISGSSVVAPMEACTWSAQTSGGSAPFTYLWWINGAYAGNTQTIWFTNEGGPFTVDVVITDNNSQTATASLSVGIQPGAPCMY